MSVIQDAIDRLSALEESKPEAPAQPRKDFDTLFAEFQKEEEARVTYKTPESIPGEFAAGVGRGFKQLGELGLATASVGTGIIGADETSRALSRGVQRMEMDLEKSPATIEDYTKIEGIGDATRYAAATLGEFTPQIAQMFVSSGLGAVAGRKFLSGFIGKNTAKALLEDSTKLASSEIKEELVKYSAGEISKEALSETSKKFILENSKDLSRRVAKYGATAATAMGSVEMEVGSIYSDLATNGDPNMSESDKRAAALTGGLVAGAIETPISAYVISKFFKGPVSEEVKKEAIGFWNSFVGRFGKEASKVIPGESFEEVTQTAVELAAQHWADPKKRNDLFTYSEDEVKQIWDAGIRGGLMGAPFAGVAALPHPNSKVRILERDLESKINDVIPPVEPTPEDIKISEISNRIQEIDKTQPTSPEQADALKNERQGLEVQLDSLTNKPTDEEEKRAAKEEEEKSSVIQEQVDSSVKKQVEKLRDDFQKQATKDKVSKPVSKERRDNVRKNIEQELLLASQDAEDTELAKGFTDSVRGVLASSPVVDFLARENIRVKAVSKDESEESKKEKATFGEWSLGFENGEMVLEIPHVDSAFGEVEKSSPESTSLKLDQSPKSVYHELIHAAHYATLRDRWKSSPQLQSDFSHPEFYIQNQVEGLGRSLEKAFNSPSIKNKFTGNKSLTRLGRIVYDMNRVGGKMKYEEAGDEILRMAVELSRTGELSEVTEAFLQAQVEEQQSGQPGTITEWLSKWMDAIRSIKKALTNLISPESISPEFLQIFNEVNQTLDKYGILVPETNDRRVSKQEKTSKGVAEKTKATANDTTTGDKESGKQLDEIQVSSQESPKETQSVKGKVKSEERVRAEHKRPAQTRKLIKTALRDKSNKETVIEGPGIVPHKDFVIQALEAGIDPDNLEYGFIEETEGFKTRAEAEPIAREAGQIPEGYKVGSSGLQSQDIIESNSLTNDEVTIEAKDENGDLFDIRMKVGDALAMLEKRENVLKALKDCLTK